MRWQVIKLRIPAIAVLLAVIESAVLPRIRAENPVLKEGDTFELVGRKMTLQRLDTLPYVENEYSRRFKFDSHDNSKLAELRTRYRLDDVVAGGRDEFDRQVQLMDWVHNRFLKFGRPSTNAHGALQILSAIECGHSFFCAQYEEVLVSAAASLGWIDRPLALRRHQGVNKVGGSTEHSVTEIWSNQHRKWVMLDPTSNMHVEAAGVPLNAVEIRQEWFYQQGTNLTFVVGKERRKYRKSDLPIRLRHFDDFGDLTVDPDEPDKYGFIGFIPNTDLMDTGYDYGHMFIVKDRLCDGTQWHVRDVPTNPAGEPYFPLGQAALTLRADGAKLSVSVKTMTPNLLRYEVQLDGNGWKPSEDSFSWTPHRGRNQLEVRTLNRFGVAGPVSTAAIEVQN
jgi:hypothetical protein